MCSETIKRTHQCYVGPFIVNYTVYCEWHTAQWTQHSESRLGRQSNKADNLLTTLFIIIVIILKNISSSINTDFFCSSPHHHHLRLAGLDCREGTALPSPYLWIGGGGRSGILGIWWWEKTEVRSGERRGKIGKAIFPDRLLTPFCQVSLKES